MRIVLLHILFTLLFVSCSHIQNGEIWSVNGKTPVAIEGYSDSTYATKKSDQSSPLDQTNPVKFVLSGTIFLYQELLSSQDGNSCQFRPSCSHYGAEAVKEHHLLGIFMSSERLLRCNPYAYTMYHPIIGSSYLSDPLEDNSGEKHDD